MTIGRMVALSGALASIALVAAVAEVAASPAEWTSASGLLPTQVCPAWTLVDEASPENPSLAAGGPLTLSTDVTAEDMFYRQSPPLITFPAGTTTTIEAGVRFVSGSNDLASRRAIGIFFNTGSLANTLYIGQDEAFLLTGVVTAGPSASVQTDDAVHTYRIEIATDNTIAVFYDGVVAPILTGSMFADSSPAQVAWGDGTGNAFGVSEWTFFRHDADRGQAPPCPVAVTFRSLTASRTAAGGVLVRWRTASELQMLGYNVYRDVNGRRVRVNSKLIAAANASSARTYSYRDRKAGMGKALRYWIQAVNLDGSRRWYGPAQVGRGT